MEDIEYVERGVVKHMNDELRKLIDDKRDGIEPPTTHFQRPGGNYRIVLRYGYKDWEELNFTQTGVLLAMRRRRGLTRSKD